MCVYHHHGQKYACVCGRPGLRMPLSANANSSVFRCEWAGAGVDVDVIH